MAKQGHPCPAAALGQQAGRLGRHRGAPLEITDPIDHMEPIRRDLRPLLIRSWIRPGVRPVDIIIVRVSDWAEERGCPCRWAS